jgi:hypothetical protein
LPKSPARCGRKRSVLCAFWENAMTKLDPAGPRRPEMRFELQV